MKKFLILSILVLFLGSLMALESGPSETVGFFKLTMTGGGVYNMFSLPLAKADYGITAIGGTTWAAGDQITDVEGGWVSTYTGVAPSYWYPSTNVFTPGNTYYAKTLATNPGLDLYSVGEVNPSTIVKNFTTGYNLFCLDEARDIDLSALGFTDAELTAGDQIIAVQGGFTATYIGSGNWYNASSGVIEPTQNYYLKTTSGAFTWTYTPAPARNGETITRRSVPVSYEIPTRVNTSSSRMNKLNKRRVK